MRRETADARKIGARRETIDGSHASRLTPSRVSGLTSRAQWPITRLGEVTVIKRGKYITRNSVRPGNVPVILGGQEPAYYCDEANHAGPCIVISRSGASAGFVSYWDQPIFVTDGFLFEANEKSNIRYLYYCLKANQSLLGHMQNGTGIPHVRGEELKTFEIPLPPLPVQRRIADILSTYDDLIENNRRRIAILEETARLFILRTRNLYAQCFLYCYLRQQEIYEKINTIASAKACQPGLNQSDVLDMEIEVPTDDKIGQFENKVSPLFDEIVNLAKQNAALAAARDILLPRLMKGFNNWKDILWKLEL